MNLAISNLAWDSKSENSLLKKLKNLGVQGIEIAPTKIWATWDDITEKKTIEYKKKLNILKGNIDCKYTRKWGEKR